MSSNMESLIPGLTYIPNFITKEQEQTILDNIDSNPWSNELKRRVQHYGYKYNYKSRSINETMRAAPLSIWMQDIGQALLDLKITDRLPDQVILNEYVTGQGIGPHIDCEPCFGDKIFSLSLLSSCQMTLRRLDRVVDITLEPRSLLCLDNEARYRWTHCINTHIKGVPNIQTRRISATFRNVKLQRATI